MCDYVEETWSAVDGHRLACSHSTGRGAFDWCATTSFDSVKNELPLRAQKFMVWPEPQRRNPGGRSVFCLLVGFP